MRTTHDQRLSRWVGKWGSREVGGWGVERCGTNVYDKLPPNAQRLIRFDAFVYIVVERLFVLYEQCVFMWLKWMLVLICTYAFECSTCFMYALLTIFSWDIARIMCVDVWSTGHSHGNRSPGAINTKTLFVLMCSVRAVWTTTYIWKRQLFYELTPTIRHIELDVDIFCGRFGIFGLFGAT